MLLAYAPQLLRIMGLLGWLYLFWHSRIRHRLAYAAPLAVGWLMLPLGALFLVEHWPLGSELLVVGALLVWLPYAYWVSRHRPISLLAWLKMAWLTGVAVTAVCLAFHLPALRHVAAGSTALFWAVLLYSLYQRYLRQPAPPTS